MQEVKRQRGRSDRLGSGRDGWQHHRRAAGYLGLHVKMRKGMQRGKGQNTPPLKGVCVATEHKVHLVLIEERLIDLHTARAAGSSAVSAARPACGRRHTTVLAALVRQGVAHRHCAAHARGHIPGAMPTQLCTVLCRPSSNTDGKHMQPPARTCLHELLYFLHRPVQETHVQMPGSCPLFGARRTHRTAQPKPTQEFYNMQRPRSIQHAEHALPCQHRRQGHNSTPHPAPQGFPLALKWTV